MSWRIKFIPDEVSSITVSINGEHALDWSSTEGEVFKSVPAKWRELQGFHIQADGNPPGKNAHLECWWDNDRRNEMKFDNGENDNVSH